MNPTQETKPPYLDAALPIDARVSDLIRRMTLLEKARQLDLYMGEHFVDHMKNNTMMADDAAFDPARAEQLLGDAGVGAIHDLYPPTSTVPNAIQTWLREKSRLGIPALFAEEALHGVCSPGHTAFPQVIGLASTWNPVLVERIGAAIAAELRSSNVHMSFGPVLDVARDARWGRTEETFGEDPYLTSRMGVAIVRGMQGESLASDHTVIAEPKHFAGHGAPEGGRNTAPLHAGPREMAETMLPPFEAAVVEGGALGIMCAYHEIDGIPCASNPDLLTGILRDRWGFQGMVLSDLGAIRRLVETHHVAADPADAIRQALTAGMDMQYYDYDHQVFEQAVISSVENGSLPVDVVDRAVSRILGLKFRLGLFDNPIIAPDMAGRVKRYAAHIELNRQAARESICLLKNDGILPLRKNVERIAVIGPNAAQPRFGDYSANGDGRAMSLLSAIRSIASPATEIDFVDGTGENADTAAPLPVSWLESGLKADLYANPTLEGPPAIERVDPTIDFNWIAALPAPGLPVDGFSVRWTGVVVPDRTVTAVLSIPPQDAMRVWLDGMLILDSWSDGPRRALTTLTAGRRYGLKVEYCKRDGGSSVMLGWSENVGGIPQALSIVEDADVVIAAIGEPPGSDIQLPDNQMALLRAVHTTGKPIIAVLMNGRPLAIPWLAENAAAIVEAWYPAEFGGPAIAEVLFGDYNPAGRLPVTFPKSGGQLPLTYDRKPSYAHCYVDMDVAPLFPFGHGLSYTEFEYSHLIVTPITTSPIEFEIAVSVKNVGNRDGDEVVQLYVRDVVGSVTTPIRALKGFERVHIPAGERRTVTFKQGERELSLIDRQLRRVVEAGLFEGYVGGSSTATLKAELRVGDG
jgi:beta-glucosidase